MGKQRSFRDAADGGFRAKPTATSDHSQASFPVSRALQKNREEQTSLDRPAIAAAVTNDVLLTNRIIPTAQDQPLQRIAEAFSPISLWRLRFPIAPDRFRFPGDRSGRTIPVIASIYCRRIELIPPLLNLEYCGVNLQRRTTPSNGFFFRSAPDDAPRVPHPIRTVGLPLVSTRVFDMGRSRSRSSRL